MIVERKNVTKEKIVELNELLWNFDRLSSKDKLEFLLQSEKKLSLEITNEIMEKHTAFCGVFSIVGLATGPSGAYELWKRYWEGSNKPEYADVAWFNLFILEVKHRANEEEKFSKELETF